MHPRAAEVTVDDDDLLAGHGHGDGQVGDGDALALTLHGTGHGHRANLPVDSHELEIGADHAERLRDVAIGMLERDQCALSQQLAADARHAAEDRLAQDLGDLVRPPNADVEKLEQEGDAQPRH